MSEHDPLDTSTQDARSDEAEKLARTARQVEIADLRWLMSGPRGRRLMWRLLDRAGVYRTSFNHSGSVTAFNEGQRNVGLQYLADIHRVCPEQFTQMLQEQKHDRSNADD